MSGTRRNNQIGTRLTAVLAKPPLAVWAIGQARQADAIKLICISQNFNDRRARAAHSD
jgi:hypothetical protein